MQNKVFHQRVLLASAAIVLTLGLSAWKAHAPTPQKQAATDTIPANSDRKIKNLDDALSELDKGEAELDNTMKNFKVPEIPPIPPVDLDKMKAEVDRAMKNVDMEKMKADIQEAVKSIDAEKIKMQVQQSLASIDWEKMKADMEKVKNVDMVKVQKEMHHLKPQLEKSMQEAKKGIENARKDLTAYKGFLDGLEKDGLIHKDQDYTIEHKNGQLLINGQTQSAEVYTKYQSFLQAHKNFKIKKDADGFNINKD